MHACVSPQCVRGLVLQPVIDPGIPLAVFLSPQRIVTHAGHGNKLWSLVHNFEGLTSPTTNLFGSTHPHYNLTPASGPEAIDDGSVRLPAPETDSPHPRARVSVTTRVVQRGNLSTQYRTASSHRMR